MGEDDAPVGALKPHARIEEVHPRRRDDERDDHRRDEDRHDGAAEGHMALAETDGRERAEADRQQRRHRRDAQRVVEGAGPVGVGEEVLVVLQRIAVGAERQHLRGEGEEVLGIEAERDHHEDRRDEEEEDDAADEAEGIAPQDFARRGIDRDRGAVIPACQPVGEPAEHKADDGAEHQAGDPGDEEAGDSGHDRADQAAGAALADELHEDEG